MNYKVAILLFMIIPYFSLIYFVYKKGHNRNIAESFSLFAGSLALWSFGLAMFFYFDNQIVSIFWAKFLYLSGSLVAATFLLFSFVYPQSDKYQFFSLKTFYILFPFLILVVLFLPTKLLINDVSFINGVKGFVYGPFRLLWELQFNGSLIFAFYRFYRFFKSSRGVLRVHLKYITIANLTINILSGTTNVFLLWFNIFDYIWLGPPLTLIWFLIVTYTIVRYRLMDVTMAFTRFSIFIIVYTFGLGLPFWSGAKLLGLGLWLIPTGMCALFATAGPSIYLYFQKKAEDRILQEEIKLEKFLKDLSDGMNDIKDIQKLLNLIVDLLTKGIKLTNSAIYLLEVQDEHHQYVLKSSNPKEETPALVDAESPLINALEKREPLVYEELKLDSDGGNSPQSNLKGVLLQIETLHASVIVPIIMGDTMLGFLVLGGRRDKKIYSQRVLTSLSNLANQAALAIENCNYVAEKMRQMEEEGQKERMESLDFMASSIAHEIDNPVTIIRQSIGYVMHCFSKDVRISMPEELKKEFKDALDISDVAAQRISAIVKVIEDYSRMGTVEMKPIRIDEAIEGLLYLLEPKLRNEKIHFTKSIEPDLPLLMGNKTHIEEIIMNFIRNSIHAVSRRDQKEITLKILKKGKSTLRIECMDNGYGIPKEIINKIFLTSTTTKGSGEGTGLGLYRVRQIVDLHKGKVWAESEGKDQGAKLIVELPIHKV